MQSQPLTQHSVALLQLLDFTLYAAHLRLLFPVTIAVRVAAAVPVCESNSNSNSERDSYSIDNNSQLQ